MNTHLFLHIVAWGVLLVDGALCVLIGLKIVSATIDPNVTTITLSPKLMIWPLIFVVALAYIVAF